MKCREALKNLYEYLDQQLDDKTVDEIREHLEKCKHCFDKYRFEENLNNLIKQKSQSDYNQAVDRLKSTVHDQIYQIDSSEDSLPDEKEDSTGFFLFRRPVLGVTALALVSVVALFMFLQTSNSRIQAEVFGPFLENHKMAVNGELAMDISTDNPFVIDSCLSSKMNLPKSIFMADSLCNPKMATIGYRDDKQFAQIIYDVNGCDVSIFCIKKSDYEFPEKDLVKLADMPNAYIYQYDSQNLLLWQCPVYWYVAVGSVDNDLIKDFVSHIN